MSKKMDVEDYMEELSAAIENIRTEEELLEAGLALEQTKFVCAALQRHLDQGGADTEPERRRVMQEALAKYRPGAVRPLSSLSDPDDGPAN